MTWKRAGTAQLSKPAARRLIREPSVRVVHFYGPDPVDVALNDRGQFWERIEPLLNARSTKNVHATAQAFHYLSTGGAKMLAVEGSC